MIQYYSWYNTPEGIELLNRPIIFENINTYRKKILAKRLKARKIRKKKKLQKRLKPKK